jgi:hypothetical protein
MKTLFCDICGKPMQDPVHERTYWHIREYDLCDPCKETMDAKLRPVVRAHVPYSTEWHDQLVLTTLEKAAQTGRF